jgi:tungstate transport system permease protein
VEGIINILAGVGEAFRLLLSADSEIFAITLLTIKVSGAATIISIITGIPLGFFLAMSKFPGKNIFVSIVNLGMGLPPVVVGLFVSLLLWRYGPLGALGLMYTPTAMVIAQVIIAFPLVVGLTFSAISSLNPKLPMQLLSLGASRRQVNFILLKEAKMGFLAAVMVGFGRVVAEVGASMMVGGNIKGHTRVLTTATVMEVGKGNYEMAIALSIILLLVVYAMIAGLTYFQNLKNRGQS